MKTKRTLIFGIISTMGLVFLLQSWTSQKKPIDGTNFSDSSKSFVDSATQNFPTGNEYGKTEKKDQSKGELDSPLLFRELHQHLIPRKISVKRKRGEYSENPENTCDCSSTEFSATLDDHIFCIEGHERSIFDVTWASNVSSLPDSSSTSSTLSNPSDWQYCVSESLRSIDDTIGNSPWVSSEVIKGKDSIRVTIKPNIPSLSGTTGANGTPLLKAFTASSTTYDSLFVIVAYDGQKNYKNYNVSFTLDNCPSYIVVYLLRTDPKTSRGTVTNVQTSRNPDPWNYHKKVENTAGN